MRQDFEIPCLELATGKAEQQCVLEDPAAQGDQVDPHAHPLAIRRIADRTCHGAVKAGGHGRRVRTAAKVLNHRPQDGGGVQLGACQVEVVLEGGGAQVESLLGRPLQVQGRLRLVGRLVAQAEQRAHRVEQASHARRRHAPDAAFELARQHRSLLGRHGAHRRQVLRPLDPGHPQVRQRRAPGPADGGIATGQRHRREVPDALEIPVAGDEDLAAPDRAVRTESRPVERDADDTPAHGHPVLGHHRRDVGVVVLHFGHGVRGSAFGPSFRLVARVRIRGQPRRPDVVQVGELTGRALEGRPRLDAAHVADVLAHEGVLARGEAERVLQLTPDRERRTCREGESERHRGVAPGTSQWQLVPAVPVDLEHGVVARDVDRPVVEQPRLGDAPQPSPGVFILVADGLVGQVATRHDQHVGHGGRITPRDRSEEQMMQGRVGEQHTQPGIVRGHQRGDGRLGRACTPVQEDDGPLGRREERCFRRVDAGQPAGHFEVTRHDGERLPQAVLPLPEPLHGCVGGCIAGEVEPAETLDGNDLPPRQRGLGGRDRRVRAGDRI